MMYYSTHMYPYHTFGSIAMFLFWALVIYLVFVWIRRSSCCAGKCSGKCTGKCDEVCGKSSHGAMNILKERYAKGEITREQFESIKKDIQ